MLAEEALCSTFFLCSWSLPPSFFHRSRFRIERQTSLSVSHIVSCWTILHAFGYIFHFSRESTAGRCKICLPAIDGDVSSTIPNARHFPPHPHHQTMPACTTSWRQTFLAGQDFDFGFDFVSKLGCNKQHGGTLPIGDSAYQLLGLFVGTGRLNHQDVCCVVHAFVK